MQQPQGQYVSTCLYEHNTADARLVLLLSHCTSGTVFDSALRPPTDTNVGVQVLRPPPRAVRTSYSVVWKAVIHDIDSFLDNTGTNMLPLCVLSLYQGSHQRGMGNTAQATMPQDNSITTRRRYVPYHICVYIIIRSRVQIILRRSAEQLHRRMRGLVRSNLRTSPCSASPPPHVARGVHECSKMMRRTKKNKIAHPIRR